MFGTMTSLWKLFYYSPAKAEKLKEVQAILNLPELKIVKPSSTRWLSHERRVKAIRKELPALILTLQQLYEASGDAEAYRVQLLLTSFSGVASVVLLSEVLNTLAKFNCFMQRKTTDFSRLKKMLDTFVEILTSLKLGNSEWCLEVSKTVENLETEYGISVRDSVGMTRQSKASSVSSIEQFRAAVAIPYLNTPTQNIKKDLLAKKLVFW